MKKWLYGLLAVVALVVLTGTSIAAEKRYIQVGGNPQIPGGLAKSWYVENGYLPTSFPFDVEVATQDAFGVFHHGWLHAGEKVAAKVLKDTTDCVIYEIVAIDACGNVVRNSFVQVFKETPPVVPPVPQVVEPQAVPMPPEAVVPPVAVIESEPQQRNYWDGYLNLGYTYSKPGYHFLFQGLYTQIPLWTTHVCWLNDVSASQCRDPFWGIYSLKGRRVRLMTGLVFKNSTERALLYTRIGKEYDYKFDRWVLGEIYQVDLDLGIGRFWSETIANYGSWCGKSIWFRERLNYRVYDGDQVAVKVGGEYIRPWWRQWPNADYSYLTHFGPYAEVNLKNPGIDIKAGIDHRSESPNPAYWCEIGKRLW